MFALASFFKVFIHNFYLKMLLGLSYSYAVDWWAFGVLIYELLAGEVAFKSDSEDDLKQEFISSNVTYPDFLSIQAVSIIHHVSYLSH